MAELKNIRIAVSGIYDYAYSELPSLRLPFPHQDGAPEWAEKKDIYKVYRPASVLAAACGKFKLLPLTHHHPSVLVDSRNFRDLTIGYTGENPFVDYLDDKDEVGIRSNVLLYDDEAQGAYERGEKQLSPGYIATFEWQRGVSPHGEPYDIVMKEISDVNHLALLPAGRGGEDAVVLDKEPERQTIFDIVRMTRDEQDANGNEHSASNGRFVSKGEGGESGYNESDKELKENYEKIQKLTPIDISSNVTPKSKAEAEAAVAKIGNMKNKTDGRTVYFPKTSVGKVIMHKGFEYAKVIPSIKALFETSQKAYSEPEKIMDGHKYHDNVIAYHNYVNRFHSDGTDYYIRFTTREEKTGRKNINNDRGDGIHSFGISEVALYKCEKVESMNMTGYNPGEHSKRPFDRRLAQFFKTVNKNNGTTQDAADADIIVLLTKETDKTFDAAGQYSKAALFETLKASKRWQPTKDGKAVYQATVTGSLTDTISQSVKKRKTIFERVQGTIFDLYAP